MTRNISLYTVPMAWSLCMAPRAYSVFANLRYSKTKKVELQNPRAFAAQVAADKSISPLIRGRIVRAENAMLNGFENLGFFASAVVAGNMAGLDPILLNVSSIVYVASRAAYNVVFVYNDTNRFVFVRTGLFMVGVAINWLLFILAGGRAADVVK